MLIAALAFCVAFGLIVCLFFLLSSGSSSEAGKTLARFDALALGTQDLRAPDDFLIVKRQEILSTLPWLSRILQYTDVGPRLRTTLYQAGLSWTVGRLVLQSVLAGLVLGYLVYWRVEAFGAAFLAALGGGALPFMYVLNRRSQRFDKMRELLPEALDLMVSALRAGHSFSSALAMVAKDSPEPLRREFRQCVEEHNFGLDMRIALSNLALRAPIHDIRIIVTAVLVQRESGGNLTEILENVSRLIREAFRLQRQVRVHTAQGRLTGWILSLLPPALGGALYLINPDQVSLLWKRPFGLKMLYTSVVMTVIGALIIRKIVRIRI